MNVPTFTCKCGRLHACVLTQRGHATEDAPNLKNNWYLAIDKLHAKYSMQATKESIEDAEAAERKACKAYLDTIEWKFWAIPDSLESFKTNGVYSLKCADTCLSI